MDADAARAVMMRAVVRRLLRAAIRASRAAIASPPVVGAAYVVALAAWAGRRSSGDDTDVGDLRRAEALEAFVSHRFASEIVRMKIGIIATAIALGIVVGLAAELLVAIRRPPAPRGRRSILRGLGRSTLLVVTIHAALVLWSMADAPQLYAPRWYAQGGVARTVQVLATDWLGPHGVVACASALALAYVMPAPLARLARRALSRARRLARVALAASRAKKAGAALALALVASAFTAGPRSLGAAYAAALVASGSTPAPSTPALHPAPPPPTTPAPSTPAPSAPPPTMPARSPSAPDGRPMNVLVLAADSLRQDRLEPRVAPNLSRLAARGTRFDRAYVSLPRTFPSWVTILTGRHGHHHGIRSMFPTWEERAKDFDALPARFARAGYATAVVSDYAGDIFGRIDLGFGRVDTPAFDFRALIRQRALERETPLLPVLHSQLGRRLFPVMRERSDAADPMLLAEDVEQALRAVKGGPFFMTVFFSTAHFPYAAPAPYYAKYTDPSYRGRFKYHKPVGLAEEAPPTPEDVRQVRALYDGAVSAVDDAVGRVLRALERLGVADRTIVVVFADHGETLFDHGHGQGHGDHLFGDEGTHVPLVVYDPRIGGGGRREARIARDVDLAPTLYELAGVAPPADLDGRSLAPALRGAPLEPTLAYAETELWFSEEIPALPPELRMPYPGIMALTEIDARHGADIVLRKEMKPTTLMARHRMARDERYKLVYVPTRAGVRYMLFDTERDPGETVDVAAALPAEVTRLRSELWAWMLRDPTMEQRDGYLVPREGALPGSAR